MAWIHFALLLLATCLYVAHALACVVQLRRPPRPVAMRRWAAVLAALVLHAAFLVSRGVQARGLPIETRLDSASLFLWVTAIVFLLASRPYRLEGTAPLFWPIHAIGAVAMWLLASNAPAARGSLERFWLLLHLLPVYIGYAGFAVAAGAGLTYLLQERLLRRKGPGAVWRRFPSLETLERLDRAALSLGFPMLTLGLVFGVLWAGRSSALLGRAWYADPKVVGGFVVWLFYAAVLHVRLFARLRGRRAALLTIVGFLLTLASFATVHVYTSARGPAQVSIDRRGVCG